MDITPLVAVDRQVITSYGGGAFTISAVEYRENVLVMPGKTLPWAFASVEQLDAEPLLLMLHGQGVELLLIGCGKRMELLPPCLRKALKSGGITTETMDTGAACRTYNVLMSEERRVAALLAVV